MHDSAFSKTEMGRKLIEWLEPYPVDLKLERAGTGKGSMPALITVADGRVTFGCDFESEAMNSGNSLPFIIFHDIGHFLAAPLTDLQKPNIGLPMEQERIDGSLLGPGLPLTVYEEEAIIYSAILLRHLELPTKLDTLSKVAVAVFQADLEFIQSEVKTGTYGRLISTWEERMAYIAPEESEEDASLEAGLGRLLGF